MPRNIRNTRRNFARPSDTFNASTSFATVTFANGSASSSIDVTKKTNPLGPSGNGTFRVTSSPAGITGTTTNTTATTVTCAMNIASTAAQTSTIFITEDNYNGAGKPVSPGAITLGNVFTANALVIGGGGAGGGGMGENSNGFFGLGGGGGAGEYREFTDYILTTGLNFTVTIGAGGNAVNQGNGNTGSTTQFHTIDADGGGGGGLGAWYGIEAGRSGGSGGSGGGGGGTTANNIGNQTSPGATYVAPAFFPGKDTLTISGTNGGNGNAASNGNGGGGGGGGASTAGVNAVNGNSGNGGSGRSSSITGSSETRAGGGGAGANSGGSGGGGSGGSNNNGSPGATNTGSGGGGCRSTFANSLSGGNGGSGIVILRYPNTRTITIGAGLTGTTATDGSFRVTTITAGTGNVSWS